MAHVIFILIFTAITALSLGLVFLLEALIGGDRSVSPQGVVASPPEQLLRQVNKNSQGDRGSLATSLAFRLGTALEPDGHVQSVDLDPLLGAVVEGGVGPVAVVAPFGPDDEGIIEIVAEADAMAGVSARGAQAETGFVPVQFVADGEVILFAQAERGIVEDAVGAR